MIRRFRKLRKLRILLFLIVVFSASLFLDSISSKKHRRDHLDESISYGTGNGESRQEEVSHPQEMATESVPCKCKRLVAFGRNISPLLELNKTDPITELTVRDTIYKRHPNLGKQIFTKDYRCNLIPFFTKMKFDGIWQLTHESNVTYSLYSASCYRPDGILCSSVTVLSMATTTDPKEPYCYLWNRINYHPVVVKATPKYIDWQFVRQHIRPYSLTCIPPKPMNVTAVSISFKECSLVDNFIEISQEEQDSADVLANGKLEVDSSDNSGFPFSSLKEKDNSLEVAVCAPALYYYTDDVSKQLVEWFVILKALDVSKVFVYTLSVHPNIMKVLNYFEKKDFISVKMFSNPSPLVSSDSVIRIWEVSEKSLHWGVENIHFTDCIQRNRNRFNYIYHIDPDEVPMIMTHDTLPQYIKAIKRRFRRKYFNIQIQWNEIYRDVPAGPALSDVPEGFFFLRHNRFDEFCETHHYCNNTKSIFDTRQTETITSHKEFSCIHGECNSYAPPRYEVLTGHFKNPCPEGCNYSAFREYTGSYIKQKDRLVKETLSIISELQLP